MFNFKGNRKLKSTTGLTEIGQINTITKTIALEFRFIGNKSDFPFCLLSHVIKLFDQIYEQVMNLQASLSFIT